MLRLFEIAFVDAGPTGDGSAGTGVSVKAGIPARAGNRVCHPQRAHSSCVIRHHEELIRGRWDTAFEDDGANNKALWQCSGLLIELCLDFLDRNVRHAIAAIVLRVPFGHIEPANQINADLRVQRDHVVSEQLSFESREQFTVPATLGLDDGGDGIEQPAI